MLARGASDIYWRCRSEPYYNAFWADIISLAVSHVTPIGVTCFRFTFWPWLLLSSYPLPLSFLLRLPSFFLRLLTCHALLYTEMITADAVLHGDRDYLLGFDVAEHPVALQLGGSDPKTLAAASAIAQNFGYDEINLNVGCPSDRVQSGQFGACLMEQPELVGDCVSDMQASVKIPVTVKCRLGVDDQDGEATLDHFTGMIVEAGVKTLIVHARKAWLEGLSPKENRNVPPLDYDRVYRLKKRYQDLEIIINGGVVTLDQAAGHLEHVDGVMVGRAAYQNPYILAQVDSRFFGSKTPAPNRHDVVETLLPYIERQLKQGVPLHAMTRHILGLFQGVPHARAWRRHLSENAHKSGSGIEVIKQALALVPASSQAVFEPAM